MAVKQVDNRPAERRMLHEAKPEERGQLFGDFGIDAPDERRGFRVHLGCGREDGGVVDYGAKVRGDVAHLLEKAGGGQGFGKVGADRESADASCKFGGVRIVRTASMHDHTPAPCRKGLAYRTADAARAACDERRTAGRGGGAYAKGQRPLPETLAFA